MEEQNFVTYKAYYKKMKIEYAEIRENLIKEVTPLKARVNELHDTIKDGIADYNKAVSFNLNSYIEFVKNQYNSGTLQRAIRNYITNNPDKYETCVELKDLVEYVGKQKELYDLEKKIAHYDKCLSLSLAEYYNMVRTYYFEVAKQMVLKGYAYHFEGALGYIIINRCKVRKGRRAVDFAKTAARKKELEAQGVQIWDKDQAEFAKKHGLEYNAVKATVYQNEEAFYEVVLINSFAKGGDKLRFCVPNTVANNIKDKTYDELLELCGRDVNKICELGLDLRKKAILCMKVDNTLYTKYIRNEEQRSYGLTKAYRKDR